MARSRVVTGFAGLLALIAAPALAGQIDPDLRFVLNKAQPDQTISVFVFMQDRLDLAGMNARFEIASAPREERHEMVVLALQALAAETQGPVLAYLQQAQAAGRVQSFREFWIDNSIRVDAFPAEIEALAAREDVGTVYLNYPIELDKPVSQTGVVPGDGGTILAPENGLIAIKAPEVWAMGIDGTGVLTSTLDTGVDGNHPALASRWRGVADPRYAGHPEWAWFDPIPPPTNFPTAFGSHGTHTMGTVCGGAPGDQVGVAPGAQWIHAACIDRQSIQRTVDDAKRSFQWMLDPDGNPNTSFDVPQVSSNSWRLVTGHGYPPCEPTFWTFLDACETAGTVVLFSAGNEGPGAESVGRPPDRATDDYRTCAVGAVDAQTQIQPPWTIAGFSSRGPSHCTPNGQAAIKPEIAAPGVNVRSSVPGNGYSQFSGTSMASPHVNGVVCLMLQANPGLSVNEVKQIFYDTAIDQGAPGNDNDFGHGMINALAAVTEALARTSVRFDFPDGVPTHLDFRGGASFRVNVTGQNVQPEPGSGRLHYDTGAGFVDIAMNEGKPNQYTAVFPALPCNVDVRFYVSVRDTQGDTHTSPFNAPQTTYTADTFPGVIELWNDNFEADRGWTVVNQNLSTGAWTRAVPIQPTRVQEPAGDFDGSGRCFVTGNVSMEDVDGGPTILTSPLIDLSSSIQYEVAFGLWFTTGDDALTIEVSNNDGSSWTLLARLTGPDGGNVWRERSYDLNPVIQPTSQMRFRFSAQDVPNNSVVEVGLDAFKIRRLDCPPAFELGDLNCDGVIDAMDVEPFTLAVFDPAGYQSQYPNCDRRLADISGDGIVDAFDIEPFIDLLFGP